MTDSQEQPHRPTLIKALTYEVLHASYQQLYDCFYNIFRDRQQKALKTSQYTSHSDHQ